MESLKKQAAKLLGEQKKYRRWLAVFLCLAVLVTAGTTAALKMNGQALSHKQKVLDCRLEVHEHTAACYESGVIPAEGTASQGEEKPVCGYADYVVHTHNDDCYGADGELVCRLPEVENHVHGDECYQEQEVLVCEKEETPGHQHTEECRKLICGKEESQGHQHTEACRTLICGKEETQGHQHTDACRTLSQGELICQNTEEGHEHTAECYEQVETITCGQEETEAHVHDESCYDFSACSYAGTEEEHIHTEECYDPYACGLEEGAEGHTHTEECYEKKRVLICGKLELHTHVTPEEAADGQESCYDAEGNLICGIPELKEHVHGEDCFVTTELTKEEVEAMQGSEDAEQDAEKVEESSIEQTLYQKTYEDESVKIVAAYYGSANIPVEAELYAEMTEQKAAAETELPADADVDNAETVPDSEAVGGTEENGDAGVEGVPESGEDDGTTEGVEPVSEEVEPGSETEIDETADPAETNGDPQVKGRTELVAGEATYKIGFRLDGAEIVPEDTVTFTVWNLEEEGSEPETIAYSAEDGFGNMTVTVGRMVEVFVQTEFQKVYEDESIRVIAQYENTANIPEEAELRVSEITLESEPERFTDCEAKFREAVEDEEAEMSALLDIGFYVNGIEVEPEDTVTMIVQFLDGEGQPNGDPINVVHFAEDKTEVLEESNTDEEGYVIFKTDSFSPFAFFQTVGATVGIGPRSASTTGIPLCELLEDGTWRDVVDQYNQPVTMYPNGGWTIVDDKLCVPIGEFCFKSLTGYDSAYLNLTENSTVKWIAYSVIVDGKEQITTGKIASSMFGLCWAFEGITNADQITGKFYYLPGNTTEYTNEALENLAGKKCTVLLQLGNGAGKGQSLTQYGAIGDIELKGSVTERVDPMAPETRTEIGTVMLPDNAELKSMGKTPEKYNFKLVGWYNITDQTYYSVENGPVEAEVDASKENIFYADWIAEDYSFHDEQNNELVIETKSTNDFITTRVFDFNELFNVYSADVASVEDASGNPIPWQRKWTLTDTFRTGTWSVNGNGRHLELNAGGGNPFIFLSGNAPEGSVNKPIGWNSSSGNQSTSTGGKGFWAGNLKEDILKKLFSENSDALGVHYVGEGDYLYSYNDSTGQYIYESKYNAASYSKGRFYVYKDPQYLGNTTAFLPFNKYQILAYGLDTENVNYHFGMCSEINFYLPETGKFGEKDLKFEFSGDDDLWVFLDDELVLDLGGIHRAQEGYINFTQQVSWRAGFEEEPFTIKETPYNEHKLTIYYMERGASESNCKISFNIKPRYLYEAAKAETVYVEKKWNGIDASDAPNVQVQLYKESYENETKKEEIIDTVTLSSSNEWKHTWEGLKALPQGSADRYKVREVELTGYDKATAAKITGSWNYWVQKPLAEGDVLILNVGEETATGDILGGTVKYALGHDLQPVEVKVQDGAISPLAINDMPDNPKWTATPCENSKQFKLSYSGEDGITHYLTYNADATSLSITSNLAEAICFEWDDKVGYGLCKADGDRRRIVYKDGGFKVDTNLGTAPGGDQEDEAHVFVYMMDSVSSRVSNYTITNTYQPTVTIEKVDRNNCNKKVPGAEFTLTRSYTTEDKVEEGGETSTETTTHYEYYHYDETTKQWKWETYDPKNPGENIPPSFSMETGELRLEEARNGEYTLTEVTAPEGYKSLPDEAQIITFKVDNSEISEVNCGNFEKKDAAEQEEKVAEIKEIANKKLLLLVKNEKMPEPTVKVRFTKNSTDSNSTALGGAKFELYRELAAEEVGKATQDKTLVELEVNGNKKNVIMVIDGMKEFSEEGTGVFFDGSLQTGTYYLKEIIPPDGYNILTDIVTITVNVNKDTSAISVIKPGAAAPVDAETDGDYRIIKILNTQGYELPETGSLGTKPFTIGGAMLITATAILMYGYSVRRKKNERRLKK